MQTERSRFPVWLWYALLCIFWWGLWGFLSKVGSGTASPMQMQILFTLGMLPVAIGMLAQITREMRKAVSVPIAAQPSAFRTTDAVPCFTKLPQFPDEMESIQLPRNAFERFAERAHEEGISSWAVAVDAMPLTSILSPRAGSYNRNCATQR